MQYFDVPSTDILLKILVSSVLGAFLGIRREMMALESTKGQSFMGFRTMIIIALMGTIGTFFSDIPYLPALLFLSLMVLVGIAYYNGAVNFKRFGITSECSAFVMFWIGVFVGMGEFVLSIILTIILAYLNAFKDQLQAFVKTLNVEEWKGAFQLLLLSGIVLPMLPTKAVDPWGLIIPSKVWLIVMLISGLGFVGYFLVKYFGAKGGVPLTAFLGAIVSSVAVTTSIASQSKKNNINNIFACGILIALGTMQFRVVGELLLLAPSELIKAMILIPVVMGFVSLLLAGYYLWRDNKDPEQRSWFSSSIKQDLSSPFELKPALVFGLIYMLVLLAVALGEKYLGAHGVYGAAAFSGIIDIDAIVLSSIEAVNLGEMSIETAKIALVIALVVNTITKLGYVGLMGSRKLLMRITPAVLINSAVGVGMLFLI